jgi:hypothetical protein
MVPSLETNGFKPQKLWFQGDETVVSSGRNY